MGIDVIIGLGLLYSMGIIFLMLSVRYYAKRDSLQIMSLICIVGGIIIMSLR